MAEKGNSSVLEQLVSGVLPSEWPYSYDSEFGAGSPWSLILSFFPGTSPLRALPSAPASATDGIPLPESVAEFVNAENDRLGWHASSEDSGLAASLFWKVWLRNTDEAYRILEIPPQSADVDQAWLDGIVRVLRVWRNLPHGDEPSLMAFEKMDVSEAFEELIAFEPTGWDLRQRLEYLVIPYLKYKGRIDLLQSWVIGASDLSAVSGAVFSSDLASSLLQVIMFSSVENWRLVSQTIDNIVPQPSHSDTSNVTLETLTEPSEKSIRFVKNLVDASKLQKLPAKTFQQLAEWTLGSAATQQDLFMRFTKEHPHYSAQDLEILRRSVFSLIDDEWFAEQLTRSALKGSRFMFLRSSILETHPDLLRHEIEAMAKRFGTPEGSDMSLQQILSALDLIDGEQELKRKFETLRNIQSAFSIEPSYVLSHEPLELLTRALELDPQSYLRYSELVALSGGKDNAARVAEQCVEAALANDNFEAAAEFFDRGFIQDDSPSAWLAYYQTGKYLSPNWDTPRPVSVLERQQALLSRSLSLCTAEDLSSVLRAWTTNEGELSHARAMQGRGRQHTPSLGDSSLRSNAGPDRSQNSSRQGARDQISNLLVSGIGWAIGANQ